MNLKMFTKLRTAQPETNRRKLIQTRENFSTALSIQEKKKKKFQHLRSKLPVANVTDL